MNSKVKIFAMILFIASLGQVAADLYLPSLPAISIKLSTSINMTQWSIASYMLSFAFSQLVYGPLSDGIGRKKPLLFGLFLLLIGSLICYLAQSISMLIIGRFLQGAGAGAGMSLSRAIIRDVFAGHELVKFGSYLAVGAVAIMASAPLFGSYIFILFGWRANFLFLVCYVILNIIMVSFSLPETNKHIKKENLEIKQLGYNFSLLLKHKVFLSMLIIIFFTYAGIISWLTVGPILLQVVVGVSPVEYGWLALCGGIANGVGGICNAKLINKYGVNTLFWFGLFLMLVSAVWMLVWALLIQTTTALSVMLPTLLFIFGTGFVFANTFAMALAPFARIAGSAGSVFCCMQIFGGAVASGVHSHLHEVNAVPFAETLLVCSIVCLLAFIWIKDIHVEIK